MVRAEFSICGRARSGARLLSAVWIFAPRGSSKSEPGGEDEKLLISKLVESSATFT